MAALYEPAACATFKLWSRRVADLLREVIMMLKQNDQYFNSQIATTFRYGISFTETLSMAK